MNCVDMFLAAFTTMSTAMTYMIYQWLIQPQTLKRIQAEIELEVGRSRLPTLDDRVKYKQTINIFQIQV